MVEHGDAGRDVRVAATVDVDAHLRARFLRGIAVGSAVVIRLRA